MTNLDSILKSRDITLPAKVHLVKAMVFPVVVYGCESWTIKKAEHQRIDAFEAWCWRRLLRVSWTVRRSNQESVLNIRCKNWWWSWSSNTLATWWENLTHLKRPWCWERLKAGGEGNDRGWDDRMASLTQWTRVWVKSWSWWWTGRGLACCSPWGHKESDTTEWLNWTEERIALLHCPAKGDTVGFCLEKLCVSTPRGFDEGFYGNPGLIPGLGRSPGEGNGYPLQYSCLENSVGRRAWQATVHGVAKTRTGLSDFHFIATVQGWGCW